MIRSASWTLPRLSRTAPTISSSDGRFARRPIRARQRKARRPPSRLFFRPSDELLEQPLEVRMHREQGAVKQHIAAARHANGGKVLHLELAHFVRLVLDIDPAELRCR